MANDKETTPAAETAPVQETKAAEEVKPGTESEAITPAPETESVASTSTSEEKIPESAAEKSVEGADEVTEDPTVKAQTLLATGKRHLLCGEVHNAIECLQTACQLLSEKHGETADECGEAYFFYGKARLELSRIESGVLGNALTGVPEEGDTEEEDGAVSETKDPDGKKPIIEKYVASEVGETEREELAAQVYDAMSEKEGSEKQDGEKMEKNLEDAEMKEETKTEGETKKEGALEAVEEVEDASKEVAEKEEGEAAKGEAAKGEAAKGDEAKGDEAKGDEAKGDEAKGDEAKGDEAKGDEEKGDDEEEEEDMDEEEAEAEGEEVAEEEKEEEDVSNIQLAWETIDLARVIFSRHESKEMQLRAAQAHLKLGEVSLELENYEQAVKDFQECLNIQRKHLDADDRLIAESCYQLGVAYSYNRQYVEAREQLREALKVVDARKTKLQKVIEEAGDDNKNEETKKSAEEELKELSDIIPDIEAKIKDTEDEEKEIKDLAQNEVKQAFEAAAADSSTCTGFSSTSEPGTSAAAKPVNVLVPRKRKAEEDVSEQTKKQRAENGSHSNGDSKNGGHVNGDGEKMEASNGDADKTKASNGDAVKADASNGDTVKTTASNGDAGAADAGKAIAENGSGDSTKDEIKTKTVEEVLEKKAEADAAMDTA